MTANDPDSILDSVRSAIETADQKGDRDDVINAISDFLGTAVDTNDKIQDVISAFQSKQLVQKGKRVTNKKLLGVLTEMQSKSKLSSVLSVAGAVTGWVSIGFEVLAIIRDRPSDLQIVDRRLALIDQTLSEIQQSINALRDQVEFNRQYSKTLLILNELMLSVVGWEDYRELGVGSAEDWFLMNSSAGAEAWDSSAALRQVLAASWLQEPEPSYIVADFATQCDSRWETGLFYLRLRSHLACGRTMAFMWLDWKTKNQAAPAAGNPPPAGPAPAPPALVVADDTEERSIELVQDEVATAIEIADTFEDWAYDVDPVHRPPKFWSQLSPEAGPRYLGHMRTAESTVLGATEDLGSSEFDTVLTRAAGSIIDAFHDLKRAQAGLTSALAARWDLSEGDYFQWCWRQDLRALLRLVGSEVRVSDDVNAYASSCASFALVRALLTDPRCTDEIRTVSFSLGPGQPLHPIARAACGEAMYIRYRSNAEVLCGPNLRLGRPLFSNPFGYGFRNSVRLGGDKRWTLTHEGGIQFSLQAPERDGKTMWMRAFPDQWHKKQINKPIQSKDFDDLDDVVKKLVKKHPNFTDVHVVEKPSSPPTFGVSIVLDDFLLSANRENPAATTYPFVLFALSAGSGAPLPPAGASHLYARGPTDSEGELSLKKSWATKEKLVQVAPARAALGECEDTSIKDGQAGELWFFQDS